MAVRARLTAPRPAPQEWRWHEAKTASLPVSLMMGGDRRLEAENFLAGGFGIRLALEARPDGWRPLSSFARVWQPSRLKGIQVGPTYGTPFLGATQVFDLRPVPRKYLALERTENSVDRFVKSGTILVTCSGSVGRATLAHRSHEKLLISHDLLRIEPHAEEWRGWIYAYLHAPQARAMMKAAQYGHIIKHLEVTHLDPLPVPNLGKVGRKDFQTKVLRILNDRTRSAALTAEAEALFEKELSYAPNTKENASGFSVSSRSIINNRQRLDAASFNPQIEEILEIFRTKAREVAPLSKVVTRIFVPGRFKHIYGDGGVPYLDSADILEVNPDIKKFVLSLSAEDQDAYRVTPGQGCATLTTM